MINTGQYIKEGHYVKSALFYHVDIVNYNLRFKTAPCFYNNREQGINSIHPSKPASGISWRPSAAIVASMSQRLFKSFVEWPFTQ